MTTEAEQMREAAETMRDALDKIFSRVSYINIHGVGPQPESNGLPQQVRISTAEFWDIFQSIGKLASEALAVGEAALPIRPSNRPRNEAVVEARELAEYNMAPFRRALQQKAARRLAKNALPLPSPTPDRRNEALVLARKDVCDEIQQIMATYRKQEAEGRVDTPGGLEHMGDVWSLLAEWDIAINSATEGTG